MEGIEVLRRVVADLGAKRLGRDGRQPRTFSGQISASEALSVMVALPVDIAAWSPLQDPDTGELYFIADASLIDGGEPYG